MGPTTLVSKEQVESGAELIRQLPANGVEVTGAAWAKVEGDGQPYLYVVSPTVEADGPLEGAHRLVKTLGELDNRWTDPFRRLDPFAIKLIGPSETLGQAVTLWYQRHPDAVPTVYHGPILGHSAAVTLDEAYIYPATMFDAAPSA